MGSRATVPNRFQTYPVYQNACFMGVFGSPEIAGWWGPPG